jgi:hypothetical protein
VLRFPKSPALAAVAVATALVTATAQQPGLSLSPFVTFLPTGTASPMAGLSIAITGGPVALRAGGHLSVLEQAGSGGTTAGVMPRPWGADADAIAYLESYHYGNRVALTPYVFVGAGTTGTDSANYYFFRQGWSYGGGLTVPVAGVLGLFGEVRARMSKFVMPDARDAPRATREFRFGVSFQVAGMNRVGEVVQALSAAADIMSDDGSSTLVSGDPGSTVARLLSTADDYVGTPYRRGGTSPSNGFDASGFVRFVFARLGITLPRSSRDQARVGERIRPDWRSVAPGDLVLFQDEDGFNHVAIYVGRARIIHSSETGGGVRYDDLTTDRGRWFYEHLVAARRITPDMRGYLLDLARGTPSDMQGGNDGPDRAPRVSVPPRRRN